MNKKYILGIAVLFLIVLSVEAMAHSYTPLYYYTFDYDGENTGSGINGDLTPYNTPTIIAGVVDNCTDMVKASTQFWNTTGEMDDLETVSTLDYWVNFDDIAADDAPWGFGIDDGWNNDGTFVTYEAGGKIRSRYINKYELDTTGLIDTTNWVHVVFVFDDGGTTKLYINGILNNTVVDASTPGAVWDTLYVGKAIPNVNGFDGQIDNLALFNEAYDAADAVWSYNTGSGQAFGGPPPGISGVPIINLTAPLNNTFNISSTQDFSYWVLDDGGILDSCTLLINSSINATDAAPTNDTLNNFSNIVLSDGHWNWTVNCTDNNSNHTVATPRVLRIDSVAPTFITNLDSNNTYWTRNIIIQINATEANPQNFTVKFCNLTIDNTSLSTDFRYSINQSMINCSLGQHQINITVFDNASASVTGHYLFNARARVNVTATSLISGGAITDFSVYINDSLIETTTIGFVQVDNLTTESYRFNFVASGYENLTYNYTVVTTYASLAFTLYTHNSINITFRDEVDSLVVDDAEITAIFISDIFNYTYTTTNGTIYVDLLSPLNYTIRYYVSNVTIHNYGGRLRHYLFELTNRTHNDLTMYVISNPDKNITVNVYDQITLDKVEGSVVYLQRRLVDNTYATVAMYETDVNGQAYFEVDDDEYYKLLVDYPWGISKLITGKMYIESSIINLYIELTEEIAEDFFNLGSIIYSLHYDGREFIATWNDPEGVATQFCLYNKVFQNYGEQIVNSSCSTSSSGTLTVGSMDRNITYYGVFTATIDGDEMVVASVWKEFVDTSLGAGRFGVFMAAVLVMVFVFLSVVHILALFLGISALMFAKLLGLITIGWPSIFGILVVSIIVAIIIEMKR